MQKLKLKKISEKNEVVTFSIAEQTHRGEKFGKNAGFSASNGIDLESISYPEFDENTLYVRGGAKSYDDQTITCSTGIFNKICAAVEEFNKHFSKPEFLREIVFRYKGGSDWNAYRHVAVTEENASHIKGIDLDQNAFRSFLRSKINGPIAVVEPKKV